MGDDTSRWHRFSNASCDADVHLKGAFFSVFEFKVMPFGLCNDPAIFQCLMDTNFSAWFTSTISSYLGRPSRSISATLELLFLTRKFEAQATQVYFMLAECAVSGTHCVKRWSCYGFV